MNLKGTHTEVNLKRAMEHEALAFVKYQIYASLIGNNKKTESKNIEEAVNHIAHNEKEHFKVWAKLLLGDDYYSDRKNLLKAISDENHECEDLYPEFARIAREEGFDDIAKKFELISKIECSHANMFYAFLNQIIENEDVQSDAKGFICLNCGYIHKGEAPEFCPVCDHPKKYFKKL